MMKKLIYYSLLASLFALGACNKIEVSTPEFDVEAISTTAKQGSWLPSGFPVTRTISHFFPVK